MLIVNDQKTTFLLTSALTLAAIVASNQPARSGELPSFVSNAPAAASAAANPSSAPVAVVFSARGRDGTYATTAHSVRAFLAERGISAADGDYLSASLDSPVAAGMRLSYRPAMTVTIADGGAVRSVRTTAATVGDLLAEQGLASGPQDEVFPAPRAYLAPGETVRVDRVSAWTMQVRRPIAPRLQERFDPRLPAGTAHTLARGSAGVAVATVRYERRNDDPLTKKVLGYQLLRPAQPRIVIYGSHPYAALENIAAQGFAGALHFAGAALHVIATAYTSSCYGCSGITATGSRAGLGIIAVDPRIIPLGTHLFIPGYGRAVAGDTGGAIKGHRVDLGFETVAAAMRFGSRKVTVYVVK